MMYSYMHYIISAKQLKLNSMNVKVPYVSIGTISSSTCDVWSIFRPLKHHSYLLLMNGFLRFFSIAEIFSPFKVFIIIIIRACLTLKQAHSVISLDVLLHSH